MRPRAFTRSLARQRIHPADAAAPAGAAATSQSEPMAKNQNTIEKQRREMEKKRRAEDKRARRQDRKSTASDASPDDAVIGPWSAPRRDAPSSTDSQSV